MKQAIVIRQFPGARPVGMAVINEPDSSYHVDDIDHYFRSKAKKIQDDFIEKFPEFVDAKFYLDIIES